MSFRDAFVRPLDDHWPMILAVFVFAVALWAQTQAMVGVFFDDGIYVSFRLVQLLSAQEKSLSELVDGLPKYVSTPEIRIACPDEDKFDVVKRLTEAFKKEHEVIDIDGARVLFGDGWGLVRVSNTQPILVMRFEARTEARLEEIRDVFREKLAAFPMVRAEEMDA